jgi:hypothetical protein
VSITVAAVSDFHGSLDRPDILPEADLLLMAGDICPIDDHSIVAQRRWLEQKFAPWLERVPARHVVGIAGNHDLIFARDQEPLAPELPWHYLQDSEIELCDLRIYGTPWSDYLGPLCAFQAPRRRGGDFMAERFWQIPGGLDILLEHAGSKALRGAIRRARPRLLVCGHVHWGRGVATVGPTLVANVCQMDADYAPMFGPMVFEVPPAPAPVRVLSP